MLSKCKKVYDALNNCIVEEIRQSEFYVNNFQTSLSKCIEALGRRQFNYVLCYGLGTFHCGLDVGSRYQLGLLILLHKHLVQLKLLKNETIQVFDPSFDAVDRAVLANFPGLEFKILEENEYCARKLDYVQEDQVVLIYMPHLDKFFYNNLLGANWDNTNLKKLVILGNSFHEMIDNELSCNIRSALRYMNLLVNNFELNCENDSSTRKRRRKHCKPRDCAKLNQKGFKEATSRALIEFAIDDKAFEHRDVFNNLSFHLIDNAWIEINPETIKRHRVKDWQRATVTGDESEWPD